MMAALLGAVNLFAQQNLKIKLRESGTGEPLAAATIRITPGNKSFTTDSTGAATVTLTAGNYQLTVSYVGMQEVTLSFTIPYSENILLVEMKREEEEEEEEEVVVKSTRTSRTIRNVPTRIETIEMEEINEKSNMRPANVAMLLHESTGIQVQQTSATSANASIRIQGLDGRYTQLLKDGFPAFGNFAGGLSVLEIPPLDLKQVEVIKGPASPLFGGGAIAGVINFISRTPKEKPEHNFIFNQSAIGQSNLGYFASGKKENTGYTLLALTSYQRAYDVDKDDFSELPRNVEFTLHPKIFFYSGKNTVITIGNSFTRAVRKGGDMQVIKGNTDNFHSYFEENKTIRNISTLELQKKTGKGADINVRQSFSVFGRHIAIPGYHFDGTSYTSFTDASLLINKAKHSLVSGISVLYDAFREKPGSTDQRNNNNLTAGAYVQHTLDAGEKIKLESGLRAEYARYANSLFADNEFLLLPRVSLLVKYSDKLTSRIGGGLGYKVPTLFTERTEALQYKDVLQLAGVRSERSYGGTADINFKSRIGEAMDISFNHMFFYTRITRPLIIQQSVAGFSFVNSSGPVDSRGMETNLKFIYRDNYKLFLGYTYTDATAKYLQDNQFLPLVPKHKLNTALIYEKENWLKMGLEGYYTGPQYLYNGQKTSDFWELGFMAEKIWRNKSVYINFENFTDTRQSRFKRVVNDPHNNPSFDDIWTHTEGFVVNAGIKIKW